MPTVVTIIVNYRTAGLVVDCLRSLADQPPGPVIVVDSASGDGSAELIRKSVHAHGWTDWVEVVELDRNLGYAAGNNFGVRRASERGIRPDFYWLLNPDTVVRQGALPALTGFVADRPRVGLVGSRLEDLDGTPQRSAFRFPSILGEWEGGLRLGLVTRLLSGSVIAPPPRAESHVTDWVAGASLLIRRECWEQAGPMDEGYFLYFEEVDYCHRCHDRGWECWYVPGSRVVHLVGQSTGVTDTKSAPRRVPDYWFAARQRYYRAHHSRPYCWLADIAWASGFALWRVRRWLQRKPDADPPGMLGDFIRASLGLSRKAAA